MVTSHIAGHGLENVRNGWIRVVHINDVDRVTCLGRHHGDMSTGESGSARYEYRAAHTNTVTGFDVQFQFGMNVCFTPVPPSKMSPGRSAIESSFTGRPSPAASSLTAA